MENVHLYIFFKELQCLTLNKKNSGTIFFRYKSPKQIYLLRIFGSKSKYITIKCNNSASFKDRSTIFSLISLKNYFLNFEKNFFENFDFFFKNIDFFLNFD